MLSKTAKNGLNIVRTSGITDPRLNVVRTLADSSNKNLTDKPKTKSKSKVSNVDSPQSTRTSNVESLGKPSGPSKEYEAKEYFGYNEYSYNDLISEMEKFRNPQPAPK